MDDFQQEHLQLGPLTWRAAIWRLAILVPLGVFAYAALGLPPQPPLVLRGVRSGKAVLHQAARVTTLELTSAAGAAQSIPLSHAGKYPQGLDAPLRASVIAEDPHQFLIFTDSFASNPGNPQGECGASPGGERYLHIVSLVPPAHETLSMIIDSCWLDLESQPRNPIYIAATHTLTIQFAPGHGDAPKTYLVGQDGSIATAAR
jgi:hypothetical protein